MMDSPVENKDVQKSSRFEYESISDYEESENNSLSDLRTSSSVTFMLFDSSILGHSGSSENSTGRVNCESGVSPVKGEIMDMPLDLSKSNCSVTKQPDSSYVVCSPFQVKSEMNLENTEGDFDRTLNMCHQTVLPVSSRNKFGSDILTTSEHNNILTLNAAVGGTGVSTPVAENKNISPKRKQKRRRRRMKLTMKKQRKSQPIVVMEVTEETGCIEEPLASYASNNSSKDHLSDISKTDAIIDENEFFPVNSEVEIPETLECDDSVSFVQKKKRGRPKKIQTAGAIFSPDDPDLVTADVQKIGEHLDTDSSNKTEKEKNLFEIVRKIKKRAAGKSSKCKETCSHATDISSSVVDRNSDTVENSKDMLDFMVSQKVDQPTKSCGDKPVVQSCENINETSSACSGQDTPDFVLINGSEKRGKKRKYAQAQKHSINVKFKKTFIDEAATYESATTISLMSGSKVQNKSNKVSNESSDLSDKVQTTEQELQTKVQYNAASDTSREKVTKYSTKNGNQHKQRMKKAEKQNLKSYRIGRPPLIGNYECDRCDFTTRERPKLIKHRKKHVRTFIYCSYCEFRSRSKETFMEHEAKHTNAKPFRCQSCSYASRFRLDLARHQSKHSERKNYSCPYCDFTTKWRRNVSSHLLRHADDRPFKCDICGQTFKRGCDLKYHLFRHNDSKPLQCDQCDFRCKTNFELRHHKFKHSDIRPFPCTHPGCKQACKTKSDLTKHLQVHTTERKYPCPICQKCFKSSASRNKHSQRHTDDRPHPCTVCTKRFKNKASLRNHLQLHNGIKPFTCDVCDRRFSNKSNKRAHMKTHETAGRPFLCPLCPYGGMSQQNLLAHVGTMHGDSYAFFCELCNKPFKRYSQLRMHYQRMHTEEEMEQLKNTKTLNISAIKMETPEYDDESQEAEQVVLEADTGMGILMKKIKQESICENESGTFDKAAARKHKETAKGTREASVKKKRGRPKQKFVQDVETRAKQCHTIYPECSDKLVEKNVTNTKDKQICESTEKQIQSNTHDNNIPLCNLQNKQNGNIPDTLCEQKPHAREAQNEDKQDQQNEDSPQQEQYYITQEKESEQISIALYKEDVSKQHKQNDFVTDKVNSNVICRNTDESESQEGSKFENKHINKAKDECRREEKDEKGVDDMKFEQNYRRGEQIDDKKDEQIEDRENTQSDDKKDVYIMIGKDEFIDERDYEQVDDRKDKQIHDIKDVKVGRDEQIDVHCHKNDTNEEICYKQDDDIYGQEMAETESNLGDTPEIQSDARESQPNVVIEEHNAQNDEQDTNVKPGNIVCDSHHMNNLHKEKYETESLQSNNTWDQQVDDVNNKIKDKNGERNTVYEENPISEEKGNKIKNVIDGMEEGKTFSYDNTQDGLNVKPNDRQGIDNSNLESKEIKSKKSDKMDYSNRGTKQFKEFYNMHMRETSTKIKIDEKHDAKRGDATIQDIDREGRQSEHICQQEMHNNSGENCQCEEITLVHHFSRPLDVDTDLQPELEIPITRENCPFVENSNVSVEGKTEWCDSGLRVLSEDIAHKVNEGKNTMSSQPPVECQFETQDKNTDILSTEDCSAQFKPSGGDLTNGMQTALSNNEDSTSCVKEDSQSPSSTVVSATLATYDDFRLPLATKGFQFNFNKTGKKPKTWFMNPDVMDEKSRDRQLRYLWRKARKVCPGLVRGRKDRKPQLRKHRSIHNWMKDPPIVKKEDSITTTDRGYIPVRPVGNHLSPLERGPKLLKEDLLKLNEREGTKMKPKLSVVSSEVSDSYIKQVKSIPLSARNISLPKKSEGNTERQEKSTTAPVKKKLCKTKRKLKKKELGFVQTPRSRVNPKPDLTSKPQLIYSSRRSPRFNIPVGTGGNEHNSNQRKEIDQQEGADHIKCCKAETSNKLMLKKKQNNKLISLKKQKEENSPSTGVQNSTIQKLKAVLPKEGDIRLRQITDESLKLPDRERLYENENNIPHPDPKHVMMPFKESRLYSEASTQILVQQSDMEKESCTVGLENVHSEKERFQNTDKLDYTVSSANKQCEKSMTHIHAYVPQGEHNGINQELEIDDPLVVNIKQETEEEFTYSVYAGNSNNNSNGSSFETRKGNLAGDSSSQIILHPYTACTEDMSVGSLGVHMCESLPESKLHVFRDDVTVVRQESDYEDAKAAVWNDPYVQTVMQDVKDEKFILGENMAPGNKTVTYLGMEIDSCEGIPCLQSDPVSFKVESLDNSYDNGNNYQRSHLSLQPSFGVTMKYGGFSLTDKAEPRNLVPNNSVLLNTEECPEYVQHAGVQKNEDDVTGVSEMEIDVAEKEENNVCIATEGN